MKKLLICCLFLLTLCACARPHKPGSALANAMRDAAEQGEAQMSLGDYAAFSGGLDSLKFRVSGMVSEIDENDALFGLRIFGFGISVGKKNACYLTAGEDKIRVVFTGDPQVSPGETIEVTGKLSTAQPGTLVDAAVTKRDAAKMN